jgi:hypothetical protein
MERLVRYQRPSERSAEALRSLVQQLGGDVRGYVVTGNQEDGFRFDAQVGYNDALLSLKPANGPWRSPGPRLVPNLVAELFTANDPSARTDLGNLGMREATSALVVPVGGRYEEYGALILQRHGNPALSDEDLKLAARWANVLGETQSLTYEQRLAKLSLVQFTRSF